MKKALLWVLTLMAFVSCKKEMPEDQFQNSAGVVNISINVNKALTRAIEDGHDGVNGVRVSPKIYSVTVLSYNAAGTLLGSVDLTKDQVKEAVWGNYRNPDGSNGTQTTKPSTGTKVGLPKNSTHVDVLSIDCLFPSTARRLTSICSISGTIKTAMKKIISLEMTTLTVYF